jgi:hypothetical protein
LSFGELFFRIAFDEMQVPHRRLDVLMCKPFFDVADIDSVPEPLRCTEVAIMPLAA